MCHNSTLLDNGLLELDPTYNSLGWLIMMGVGLLSAVSIWMYDRWLTRQASQ